MVCPVNIGGFRACTLNLPSKHIPWICSYPELEFSELVLLVGILLGAVSTSEVLRQSDAQWGPYLSASKGWHVCQLTRKLVVPDLITYVFYGYEVPGSVTLWDGAGSTGSSARFWKYSHIFFHHSPLPGCFVSSQPNDFSSSLWHPSHSS